MQEPFLKPEISDDSEEEPRAVQRPYLHVLDTAKNQNLWLRLVNYNFGELLPCETLKTRGSCVYERIGAYFAAMPTAWCVHERKKLVEAFPEYYHYGLQDMLMQEYCCYRGG